MNQEILKSEIKIGRLTLISKEGKCHNRPAWKCLCDCGVITFKRERDLARGWVKSCGCLRRDTGKWLGSTKSRSHGEGSHHNGKKRSPTYLTWQSMKQRCRPNNDHHKYYAGRGITVCQEWDDSYETFVRDMGERPSGKTLDRINNDLGYFKENCRWATPSEQMHNRRPLSEETKKKFLKNVEKALASRGLTFRR